MNNQAFVDGQNLYMNTNAHGWKVDLKRFRVYLKEQYNVEKAYYFLGAVDEENQVVLVSGDGDYFKMVRYLY